ELGREKGLPPEEAAKILYRHMSEERPHNRGWYRINAIRGLTGGKKLIPKVMSAFQDVSLQIMVSNFVLFLS
ncbi:sodium/calcium exchanger 1-like, partial [Plakobranchus ocellatus]